MTLAVIGAGFGRTGTMSTKLALEALGLGPCHHMHDVFTKPDQLPHWQAAVQGQPVNWSQALDGYRSAIDWPSTHSWDVLARAFPEAKIVLSVRPAEDWWRSFAATIGPLIDGRHSVPDPYRRSVLEMAHEMISQQTFGGMMKDKAHVLAVYRARIKEVKRSVTAERLLVYDVAEGWSPLCDFLGVPVPSTAFPRANNAEEFWSVFGGRDQ